MGTKTSSPYAAYRLLIGVKPPGTLFQPKTSAVSPGTENDNVLGNPAMVRTQTSSDDFVNSAAAYVPAHGPHGPTTSQGFLLLGPPEYGANSPFAAFVPYDPFSSNAAGIPRPTPVLRTPNLEYKHTFLTLTGMQSDERTEGIAVVLRRLANPYLPFDGNRTFKGNPNF